MYNLHKGKINCHGDVKNTPLSDNTDKGPI